MYGAIMRYRVIPGLEGALAVLARAWLREGASGAIGLVGEYVLAAERDPQERFSLVIFESEATYRKHVADLDQEGWYRRFRAQIEADPEWIDGAITSLLGATVPL